MPTLRTYPVFICHDWEYSNDYGRICKFLNDAPNFSWENLSVPEHEPLDTDEMLEKNLRDQIRPPMWCWFSPGCTRPAADGWTGR